MRTRSWGLVVRRAIIISIISSISISSTAGDRRCIRRRRAMGTGAASPRMDIATTTRRRLLLRGIRSLTTATRCPHNLAPGTRLLISWCEASRGRGGRGSIPLFHLVVVDVVVGVLERSLGCSFEEEGSSCCGAPQAGLTCPTPTSFVVVWVVGSVFAVSR